MRKIAILGLLGLAACGMKEEAFQTKFVDEDCDFALRCYDPAILEFYGWTDQATCVSARGDQFLTDVQGCTYDKKAAKDCVKAYKDLACPSSGDPTPPEVCATVYTCSGADTSPDDTNAGDTSP